MAKPPITKTLRAQDYIPLGTEEGLAHGLTEMVRALNNHIAPVASALNGQLTIEDNLKAQWHTTSVLTTANDYTTVMASDLKNAFTLYDHINYPVQYRRLPDGDAELSGGLVVIPAGPPAFQTPILQLPATYAPATERVLDTSSSDAYATIRVDTHGRVVLGATAVTAGNWLKLSGRWTPADRYLTPLSPWPYDFSVDFPDAGKPRAVLLAEAREQSGQGRAISLSPVDWAFVSQVAGGVTTNRIRVTSVPGLTAGKSYVLTFLVLWA